MSWLPWKKQTSTPASIRSSKAANTLTYPFGTTSWYSYQKSQMSPKKVQCLRPVHRNGLQEPHKAGLPVGRVIHVQPEMDIRNKVNKRPFRHDVHQHAMRRQEAGATRQGSRWRTTSALPFRTIAIITLQAKSPDRTPPGTRQRDIPD